MGLFWSTFFLIAFPVSLVMRGSAYGNPDAAALLLEPLPEWHHWGTRRREVSKSWAEEPKLMIQELEKTDPDKAFEIKRYKVMVKGDAYILIPGFYRFTTPTPIFIRFFRRTTTSDRKTVVPYGWSTRKTRFARGVAGFPIAKFRGEFSLPVDVIKGAGGKPRETYAKGLGLAYLVLGTGVRPSPFTQIEPRLLDKNTIPAIFEELSKEESS